MTTPHTRIGLLAGAAAIAAAGSAAAQHRVIVDRDDVVIDRSCIVEIPRGTVIADANGDGVIHITADGVTVDFADGSVLRGAPDTTPWNELAGYGVRIDGATGVTLRGLRVRGFKGGVWATGADRLTVEDCDLSDNYRARLTSTPIAEGSGDWLSPHRNDNNEWLRNYGAALYIEDASDVTVRRVFVRRGQNGIILDRVTDSKIYDNDCSFLSGWGLGMWRATDNLVSRNAFDFCVRGHVEGVYNRGQDSAGILMFEQCSRNTIVENSCTHGGDAIFGFAGLDALGEGEYGRTEKDRTRLGCNDNIFIGNDLSYAPAHGWEMTFSFGNVLARNRLVENAICGVWGGFSQETLIAENEFDGNGGMAYGLERGGVNIEHGRANRILNNHFENNRVGVHLWYDEPGAITGTGWGAANYGNLGGSVIAGNTFVINDEERPFHRWGANEKRLILQIRDDSGKGLVGETYFGDNTLLVEGDPEALILVTEGAPLTRAAPEDATGYHIPSYEAIGETRPVGARDHLRGRDNIIMTEWGPWDHEEPMFRVRQKTSGAHEFEVFGIGGPIRAYVQEGEVEAEVDQQVHGARSALIRIVGGEPGVHPYEVTIRGRDFRETVTGTFVGAEWDAKFWTWETDPLENLEAWRAEAEGDDVFHVTVPALNFPYGWRGPREMGISDAITREGPGGDRFAMIATTRIPLTAGTWRIQTTSDDGVRVFIDGEKLFERWDIHGPTPDTATFEVKRDGPVEIKVEHFENNGFATFTFDIEKAN
ncbi:MAG: right-handed parallel beta-helix repeat-containing protein [Phycisphaerales bacterium JB039]